MKGSLWTKLYLAFCECAYIDIRIMGNWDGATCYPLLEISKNKGTAIFVTTVVGMSKMATVPLDMIYIREFARNSKFAVMNR